MACCRGGADSPSASTVQQLTPSPAVVKSTTTDDAPCLLVSGTPAAIKALKSPAVSSPPRSKIIADDAAKAPCAAEEPGQADGFFAWLANAAQVGRCTSCSHVVHEDVNEAVNDVVAEDHVPEIKDVVAEAHIPEATREPLPEEPVPSLPERPHAVAGEQPVASEAVAELTPTYQADAPDFSGKWFLVRTNGDVDAFMADMGANWIIRRAGKALKYGVGRVVITMHHHDENKLKVKKVMADPTKRNAVMDLTIGEGWTNWNDEFGPCEVHTYWRDDTLVWDSRLLPSGCASTMNMYYAESGELVEEYISPNGITIQYFFEKRSASKFLRSLSTFLRA